MSAVQAGPAPLKSSFRSPAAYNAEAIKRRGFREHGILAIDLDDPRLSWADKMALRMIGEKLYGATT